MEKQSTRQQSAEQLGDVRRLASRYGVPIEIADRLTLRPREVARATGFSLRSIESWIASGRLPAVRIDRSLAVPLHDLLGFLEANRSVPREPAPRCTSEPKALSDRAAALIDGVPLPKRGE